MEHKAGNGECAKCGMGMCGEKHWMHVVIKIAIALIIFWAGVQFGELKGMLRATYGGYSGVNYGYGMMGSYGTGNRVYGPGMMYRVYNETQNTVSQPAATATTSKK
ncbi:MAG: hypothetical protein WC798_00065 [Candidatus Paceibacterota bacterium]|jgi:hypothetical protein